MSDSAFEQQIREFLSGVRLHRERTVTPFAHIAEEDEPLVDHLFAITRPSPPMKKRLAAAARPEPVDTEPAESLIPKGMVNYRRERSGDIGDNRSIR